MIEKLVNRDLASNADILVWNEVVPDKNWWFISQYIFSYPSHDRFSKLVLQIFLSGFCIIRRSDQWFQCPKQLGKRQNWKQTSLHGLRFSVAVLELKRTIWRKKIIRMFGNFMFCSKATTSFGSIYWMSGDITPYPSLLTRNSQRIAYEPVDLRYWKLDQIREKKIPAAGADLQKDSSK